VGGLSAPQRIVHSADGYALIAAASEIDAKRFEELTERARDAWLHAGSESASALFGEALGLWRGPAYAGLHVIPFVADEARRLDEQRWLAYEEFIGAGLDVGRHAELIGELRRMTPQLPYRERLCALLMLALYRAGRQVEALATYRAARSRLVGELGVEPGPILRYVHEAILKKDDILAEQHVRELLFPGRGLERTLMTSVRPAPALLPPDIADFVGRSDHIGRLVDLLTRSDSPAAVPLVALVGRAGVGKTTLAVHVAHRLTDTFPDGQLFVDLHGAGPRPADPLEVLGRFLVALGMEARALPEGLDERRESFRGLTAGRRILLVLDNAAGVRQIQALLPGDPTCAVLVTSQRPIGALSAHVLNVDGFDDESARALLERIAGRRRVSAEPEAAAEIARLCGHLPLAIRVSGARLAARRHWRLGHLADRLRDEESRLDELTDGDVNVRASLTLGYQTLTEETKRALRLLGLLETRTFPGWVVAALLGTSLKKAEHHVEALLDSGLLADHRIDASGQPRYRFHDLVRLFARERAEAEETAGQRKDALTCALGAWLGLAEAADHQLPERAVATIRGSAPRWNVTASPSRPLVGDALTWFDSERASLVAAVEQACRADLDELAWELSACTVNYYAFRGLHEEWSHTHELALETCVKAGNALGKAVMSRNLGCLRMTGLKTPPLAALDDTDEATTAFRRIGSVHGEVDVLSLQVFSLRHQGDFDKALIRSARGMVLAERAGYALGQARLWYGRAVIHREQGRYEYAARCARECFALARHVGTAHDRVLALWELSATCRDVATYRDVVDRLHEGIDECRTRNERLLEAYLLLSLNDLHIRFGQPGDRALLTHALAVFQENKVLFGQGVGHRLLGRLDGGDGKPERAVSRLTNAARIASRLRRMDEQALALTALGNVHHHHGDRRAAERAWKQAQRLYEQISNTTEVAALEASLRAMGVADRPHEQRGHPAS
jgi:tetratricopeptide (TPR) repeat protein